MPSRLFQVKAGPFLTEVLETHFTVNFTNQQDAKVTLVEGRIRVSNEKESLILSSGQKDIGDSHKMDKLVVDIMDLLSWKEGYFKLTMRVC